MAICAVVSNSTDEQVNLIVADPADLPPEGCRLVEIPAGYRWDASSGTVVPIEGS